MEAVLISAAKHFFVLIKKPKALLFCRILPFWQLALINTSLFHAFQAYRTSRGTAPFWSAGEHRSAQAHGQPHLTQGLN